MSGTKTATKAKATVNFAGYAYRKDAVGIVKRYLKSDEQTQNDVMQLLFMVELERQNRRRQG